MTRASDVSTRRVSSRSTARTRRSEEAEAIAHDLALTTTLHAVAAAMAGARLPWWVIGSAAVALHGAKAGRVADVDVLLDADDARRLLPRMGLAPMAGTAHPTFRSALFATWRDPPLPVEFMVGFEHRSGSAWRPVDPTSRTAVRIYDATIYVPAPADLERLLRSFGRPKDIARADALAQRTDRLITRSYGKDPMIHIQRLSALTFGDAGGNPAGVVLCDALPETEAMQTLATEIGYSETVFAALTPRGHRVRYFAPAAEIPFCGHATIALGAALADRHGDGSFPLELNDDRASVDGRCDASGMSAALTSPPPRIASAPEELQKSALALFDLAATDLYASYPPAIIEAGARHLLMALNSRNTLAAMRYDMEEGAELMRRWRLATISVVFAETPWRFHARNPFAAGGVYKDPATGAAAALADYLKAIGVANGADIEILQGVDMGVPCLIHATTPARPGLGARVHGTVRRLRDQTAG